MAHSCFLLALSIVYSVAGFDILPEDADPKSGGSCHLPSGVPALCVPLANCAHITALAANLQKPISSNVAFIIRDSYFCPVRDGKREVCCPLEGVRPRPTRRPKLPKLGKQLGTPKWSIGFPT